MSAAGIRSNQGDIYQTLVAFDWALTILSDPEFQWLEIDSTTYPVDDVVVGKSNGSLICCQCKKNQADFRAWSIADLADELDKASSTLSRNQQTQVRFYSRSEFGALAKLREYSSLYGNQSDYLANLTKDHTKTNCDLAARIVHHSPDLSTYEFLRRASFEISPDFDRMKTLLRERLCQMASNSKAAFDALWTRLDELGGRLMNGGDLSASTQHRLTKDDLKDILHQAGAMLVPGMSIAQVSRSFASTSAIGRSWRRDIAGQRISSPVVTELMAAVDNRKRTILLTGVPGSGKTCVMLNLQEALEQRMQTQSDLVSLFIQSREFADLATAQERQAQGLPNQWVEQAARLADDAHVVVIIDSLDVLSIAREHSVLNYFLAQIDQLLLIPNVTVITACRDFDRKYDRRIAVRTWSCELRCPPLDWETEITPLLDKLGINSTTIDAATRELIRNPRELSMFVELIQRQGSFDGVTSQALAQRYLDNLVRADPALGDAAVRAIEAIADAMLKSRSLSIPHQRFSASQDILGRLRSLNVLQATHDEKLTFGHQTLLDVLVVSGALRQGFSLNEFIQGLPPVPFVRPSIRSFVAQLATGDRREYRKQLRAVLTGSAAFHIRRLVAESFAQQMPQDGDWPLIQGLRDKHREVFQVIYTEASFVEWHYFWLSHLVPALKETRDAEGLKAHVHRVTEWGNEDTAGVLGLWMEALSLEWLEDNRIADQLAFSLSGFKSENLPLVAPLLDRLLSLPKTTYSSLGRVVARCIQAGAVGDSFLWRYIAGDICGDDLVMSRLGNKLHCQPHEFGSGSDNFLIQRMVQSTALLNLALDAIEQWSQIQSRRYGETRVGYRYGFLLDTSYAEVHTQTDDRQLGAERILMDAIEAAIVDHAKIHSDWWQKNRERLCFNKEGSLCYFAVRACMHSPQSNIDLIGRLLSERNLLEFELLYELGTLVRTAFIYLDSHTQDAVMAAMQTVWEEPVTAESARSLVLRKRAEHISAIPCHLRSAEAQAILDTYERIYGTLIRQPPVVVRGGWVAPPFSFEVFLSASNDGVIRLLTHYSGYNRDFDDSMVGGKREVGLQLSEASSRHPSRFLKLLSTHWTKISADFRNSIMDGIANNLAYRYGKLRANDTWIPIEEPDASTLANQILDELETHPSHWQLNRSAAEAMQASAHVIQDTQIATRLTFLALGFVNLKEECSIEEYTIKSDALNLITTGINMTTGKVVEALMIIACSFQERGIALPDLLPPTLSQFAGNQHPAVRALILQHLPYLQSQNPELGWKLFHLATQDAVGLWPSAERCLYYAYHSHFEKVAPSLERICREGNKNDMETWGRISALSALSARIDFINFLSELKTLDVAEAWKGAASVWTNHENIRLHREQCLVGMETGLKAEAPHASAVVRYVNRIFREDALPIAIPVDFIQLFFCVYENDSEDKRHHLPEFSLWLNATSHRDPDGALAGAEIFLAYLSRTKPYFYDHENQLVQLMTRLFAEAEEREESDRGAMLQRVVSLQDLLLSLGGNSINEWLKAAERQ